MASRTVVRFTATAFVAACVWLLPAHTQEKKAGPGQAKHIVYMVKLGSAKDIAAVLSKQFNGDAEVDALPEPNSNCLLIRANDRVFDDVLKVLQALDRRPRLVTVEVWVTDVVPPKTAEKGEEAKPIPIDVKGLTGPSGEVMVQLREMQRKGQLGSLKRLQMTVAENQSGAVLEGEHQPVVVGTSMTGTGIVSRRIMYQNTGTSVRCTPRVADDQTVMLDLRIEEARIHVPSDGIVIGEGEKKDEKIRATETIQSSYNGTVTVGPGRAVLLREVKLDGKTNGPNRTLFVATARGR